MKENIFYFIQSFNSILLLGWTYVRAKSFSPARPRKEALDLAMILLAAGLIGGRLAHVFFEYPQEYMAHPLQIFNLAAGGYVYFGGLALASVVGFLWIHFYLKQPLPEWLDFFAPLASLGTAIGRVGCFFAGCCYGKFCDLPWAIEGRHPTQLYSVFSEILILLVLLGLEKYRLLVHKGDLFWVWLGAHCSFRFLIEFWRDDFRGAMILGLSQAQVIAIILVLSIWPLRKVLK